MHAKTAILVKVDSQRLSCEFKEKAGEENKGIHIIMLIAERLSARHIIVTLFSVCVYIYIYISIYIYMCVTLRNAPRDPENH